MESNTVILLQKYPTAHQQGWYMDDYNVFKVCCISCIYQNHALDRIILGMGSANERRRYIVTPFLIGWAHTQNDLCLYIMLYGTGFLAATKQLYKWYFPSVRLSVCPSVRLSVRPSHLFDYVPIIVSSWNFLELLPVTEVTSMQKFKVRGQRSRSQRSQPNFTVSGL